MHNKTNSVFALLMLIGWQAAYANTSAPITAVTLYPGSATVERTAQVAPGMTQLEIKGLPANFDTQTIRVQTDAGIQIGQIIAQDISSTEAIGAREADIEAKIQALQDQQAALDVDAKSAALVQGYLERFSGSGAAATDKQQPYIDAKSMAAVLDAMRRGGSDAFERIHRADMQKREIGKKIDALQRELAKVKNGAKDARTFTIQLAAKQSGNVRLSYQVNGAGWKPSYRAMLDSSASSIDLERLASVSQKTGEDWSGVKLKLSTGQPRLSPQAPEPRPWLLSYYKPEPQQYRTASAAHAPAPAPAPSPMIRPQMKIAGNLIAEDYVAPVIETQGSFATEFDVPARVSLPSDGREISVNLSKQTVPVKQRVRVAPRMDKSAVVTAEAARPSGVWLSGNIQLFRDGSYVGATQWNTQASDKFVFPFGRDDLVRVAVDRTRQESGTTGLLSRQSERKVSDVYTITSFHKTPVELLVLESSPVSTSEEVKVEKNFSPQPSTQAWEQRQGVVAWEQTIAPNQTLKWTVDYHIVYPQEGSATGLP